MDAFQDSTVGAGVLDWLLAHPRHGATLRDFRERFAFDPLEDLSSATLYGRRAHPGEAVLLARTSPNIDLLLARSQAHASYGRRMVRGLELHTWRGGGLPLATHPHAWIGRPLPGEERVAIVASLGKLVVDGTRAARLGVNAPGPSELVASPDDGAFLFLETGRPLADLGPFAAASGLAHSVQHVTLHIGEHEGLAFLDARLETGSEEEANAVSELVRGALGLSRVSLHSRGLGALGDQLSHVTLEVDGLTVHARYETRAQRVVPLVQLVLMTQFDEGAER